MSAISTLQNQLCLAERTANIVDEIVNPLFTNFHMNHFAYVKFFADGKILRLSSNTDWTRKYLELGLYREVNYQHPQIQNIVINGNQNFLKVGQPQGNFNNALYEHNIWNSLTIAKRDKNTVQTWCFGTDRNNTEILNFYLNNIHMLENFILYFMRCAHDILTSYNEYDLIIADNVPTRSSQLITSHINVKPLFSTAVMTSREQDIISCLLNGEGAKQTARNLNISPRTVERHLENIKIKLGCRTKYEIINKILSSQSKA